MCQEYNDCFRRSFPRRFVCLSRGGAAAASISLRPPAKQNTFKKIANPNRSLNPKM